MLVLLCLTVSGAWAQIRLLTTIVNTGDNASFTSGSKTFDNKATVTFSGEVYNFDDEWGWWSQEERTLTVTAAEGYTITRVKFYTDKNSAFDEEAPFEAILVNDGGRVTKVNGISIGGGGGVTKIEVYGYAGPPVPTYDITVKGGTEDATSWQGKAGTGEYQAIPLEGVALGRAVSVKYNGTKLVKSVNAKKKATAGDKGKLICADGHIHANGAEDAACTADRVAMIVYVGPTGHDTYKNGLALALTDEGQMAWEAAKTACNNKNTSTPVTGATWLLASKDQWEKMGAIEDSPTYIALRYGFSSVGGSNLQSGNYWSSTEVDSDNAWGYSFEEGNWYGATKASDNIWVRACLAFWAQETVTLNHSAYNTWAIAEMPGNDVELEVEYFNITVPTANTADIYAGTTTPLINAGSTTEDGATMKYLVTATNEQPTSTDGFSADVPTAQATAITGQGTYYVWYYLDFASGADSDISALAVEVTVSGYAITMKEGTLDATNWQGKAGEGEYQALPLEGVAAGTAVTVKYNGTKKVKSVKATKMAAATVTTAPTAKTGVKVGQNEAIVNAGTAEGGTMMYMLNATQPTSTDGFSATVPTAERLRAGTYYVWYYVKADDSHTDSEISATGIEVTIAAKAAAEATAEDKGKLIGTDGKIYADVASATAAATTAVAMIVYVGPTGHATYSHGLALALTDEENMDWEAAMTACNNKNTSTPVTNATWLLASKDQWNYMVSTDGAGNHTALRDGFSGITGASNMQSDYYWSSTPNLPDGYSEKAWYFGFNHGDWWAVRKDLAHCVRACLVF